MKTKIKIEVERTKGKTFFTFEIDKELENLFKEKADEIKTSQSWLDKDGDGLKFYSIPSMTTSPSYKNLLYRFRLVDDFGTTSLYNASGYFNIGFVRTVGGKGSISITEDIPFATVSSGVKDMVAFLKEYYTEYLREYKVKGLVNFEV